MTSQDPRALSPELRTETLAKLASMPAGELDMIIIGAGITGAGVALDAVTRGLKVAIIEKEDIAFGTSRWSSKLAHGGLRYLAKMELGIAHSSAVERGILLEETAPHLVHSIAQVVPLNDAATTIQQGASRVGFIGGDLLRMAAGTSGDILPHSHYQSVSKTLEMCPGVSRDGLKGSWVFYDGQMIDDARIVTCAIRTAAEKGCLVLTHAACSDVTGTSVTVTDQLGGKSFTLSAKSVVSATGVWAGHIDNEIKLRPARGTHLVIDAAKMGNPTGQLTVPLLGSISRYLFAIPEQLGRIYLGLTDEETRGEIVDVPPTPEEDIDFLLKNFNSALEVKLTRDDVIGAFTGYRPLIDSGEGGSTSDLSRRHAIIEASNGLISIVGGKFTEYRLMAEETVDEVIKRRNLSAGPCITRTTPFIGAPKHSASAGVSKADLDKLPASLVARFGHEAPNVVASCPVERPLEQVAGMDITRAEFAYAVTHEGAMTVDDILDRRTRVGLVKKDRDAALPTAQEMIDTLVK